MKMNIATKEYLTLLEILEIADWVLHAHHSEERSETGKYRDFEQKVFSHAKDRGYENLIEYDEELGAYFPTRELEDTSPAMEFIREFENGSGKLDSWEKASLARIDHRFGNEGDFGRPERFSESFAIDPVQVE